ncbi:hypothetical protein P355_3959 [Burkholderia cenocepacia KC-01]|nr:hypothetical protein P355_3959 [Burkholderia cenocepacia KC-01]
MKQFELPRLIRPRARQRIPHARRPRERMRRPLHIDRARRMNLDVAVLDADISATTRQQNPLIGRDLDPVRRRHHSHRLLRGHLDVVRLRLDLDLALAREQLHPRVLHEQAQLLPDAADQRLARGHVHALTARHVHVIVRDHMHRLLRRHPDSRRAAEQHHRFLERVRVTGAAARRAAARRAARLAVLRRVRERAHRVLRVLQALRLMLLAHARHRLDQALARHELLLRLLHVERLAVRRLRVRRHVQALARPHRAIRIRAQIETAAQIRPARIAVLVDDVAQMQQAVRAAAHQLHAVLPSRVVHHELVVAAARILLRSIAGQNPVAMPLRLVRAVVHAPHGQRPVAVAADVVDQHFLADARHVHTAVAAARIRLHDAHPARRVLVARVQAIPHELHANPVQLVGINLLALRPDDDRRLEVHLRLAMLERAAIRHVHALRFDLDEIEADRAVVVRHAKRGVGTVALLRLRQRVAQAVRKIRAAVRNGQVVLDPPFDADRREFALVGRIAIVFGMIRQREAPAGIDRTHAARAVEALRLRLPLLHPDLRQMIAACLVQIRVRTGVFVDFELIGQFALTGHRRQRRAFRIRRLRGILVVERARRSRDALQRARARPLRERIGFARRPATIEAHGLRRQRRERLQVVGHHERVRLAVVGLLPRAVEPFVLHQPMHEMPVDIVLSRVRAVRQRLRQRKAEMAFRLRMLVQHVADDLVDGRIVPDPLVATELQEMGEIGERELIGREPAVGAQTTRGVHVAIHGPIAAIALLNPQRDRLRDQLFKLQIAIGRQHVERELVRAPDPRTANCPLHGQDVAPQWRIELQQPVLLKQPAAQCGDCVLHVHGYGLFFF